MVGIKNDEKMSLCNILQRDKQFSVNCTKLVICVNTTGKK